MSARFRPGCDDRIGSFGLDTPRMRDRWYHRHHDDAFFFQHLNNPRARITAPIRVVNNTITTGITLGSIWRQSM